MCQTTTLMARLPFRVFRAIAVSGSSMSPTYNDGDWLIFRSLRRASAKLGETSTAIVRVEQLYPFPIAEFMSVANKHPNANLLWVQDEPANQGPYPFVALNTLEALEGRTLRRVSRRATASPATGSHHLHEEEQHALITEAFTR